MNKKTTILGLLIAVQIILSETIQAKVTLPAIFADHMVLQQQTDVVIWGKATAGASIKVQTSWDKEIYSAQADIKGEWKLKVKTSKAGGPFEITFSDGEALTLHDILVGEVWVCSGQSNMQMPMKGYRNQPVLGSNKEIAASENSSIRLFTVGLNKSLKLLDNFRGEWQTCEPQNVVNFSATAYYFGKMLQERLDVPIGLISSSWGGTRIEPWISENGLTTFDWVNTPDKNQQSYFSQQTPTVLFNAMIAPMLGYGIRGVIWYQGESNHNEPVKYEKLMAGLVQDWRSEWGIGDFPFYYVQIAPFGYQEGDINSAYLREAQLKASTAVPNTGMACIMDLGENDCIHPANKEATGQRLAYLALAKTYDKRGVAWSGPVLKDMDIDGSLVNLTFDHADNGLTTFGKKLENFEVAGEDKRFSPAHAYITKKGVTIFSEKVQKPIAVRYAFKDFVVGELFNTEGLPASSFRTDDFPIE